LLEFSDGEAQDRPVDINLLEIVLANKYQMR